MATLQSVITAQSLDDCIVLVDGFANGFVIAPIKCPTSKEETVEVKTCITCNGTNVKKYDMKKKVDEIVDIIKEYKLHCMIISCDSKECKGLNGSPMRFIVHEDKSIKPEYKGSMWNCEDCTETFRTTYDLCEDCVK